MGAIVGKQRRYMQGMMPSEYWEEIAWPENRETLEVLRFTHDQALTIFRAFVDVDRDCSGEMSVEEFHEYLGVPITRFSERVFGIIDLDGSLDQHGAIFVGMIFERIADINIFIFCAQRLVFPNNLLHPYQID